MTAATALVLFAALAAADDPVVLEFTSANCPHCRTMEPVVRGLAQQGFPIRQIDGRAQRNLVQQYKIKGFPTFVLVSGGREISRIEGAASRDRLVGLLKPATAPQLIAKQVQPAEREIVRGQSPETSRPTPLDAAVRLHVQDLDGRGAGVGSGTIIDTHFNEEAKAEEALIITCGHLFRDSQGKGKITVDLFAGGQVRTVDGQLLDFDDKRDIALVTIWPGVRVAPVQVAPKEFVCRPQDRVFTIGCSEGREPTVEESRVTVINRFTSKPNINVAGIPANGRSGGGLFSAEGLLIGVCNAANETDNEGLYASLPTVHWQLDKFNLQAIYQRASSESTSSASIPPTEAESQPVIPAYARQPEPAPRNQLPARPAPAMLAGGTNSESYPERSGQLPPAMPALEETGDSTGSDMEVVVIVRSKQRPENPSEIYLVDSVSPDLLTRITTAARASAQARASNRQIQSADRMAGRNRNQEQPVVRGQLK